MPMTKDNQLTFPPPTLVREEDVQTETIYERTSCTIICPPDATVRDQMNIVEASGSLDFWNDPAEDIYSMDDGDAV
jgi:hypothetical protein